MFRFFPFRMKEGLDGISFIGKGKVAEVIQKNDTGTFHKEDWGFSHLMTACIINFIALITLITIGMYLWYKRCKAP